MDNTAQEQVVLPVVAKRFVDDSIDGGIDDSVLLYRFSQLFNSADGSGAYGGITEDPTSKNNIQITGGALTGVAIPDSNDDASTSVINTLTTAIGGGVVSVNLKTGLASNFDTIVMSVKDSLSALIVEVTIFRAGGSVHRIIVSDKDETTVATVYDSTPLSPVDGDLQIHIDLINKLADIFSSSWTLSNNTDIDLSNGGGMVSTDIKTVPLDISSVLLGSTAEMKYHDLKISQS